MTTGQRRALAKTTPTTEVIRDAVTFPRDRLGEPLDISGDRFDAWLAQAERDAAREALTTLAAEHQARSVGNGLISDMHLMAQQRAEAWRDHTYPETEDQT